MKSPKILKLSLFSVLSVGVTAACDVAPRSSLGNGSGGGSNQGMDASASTPMDAGSSAQPDAGPGMMAGNCPEAENFIDVSQFPGPGGSFTAPTLAVSCTGDRVMVASNGMPHYEYQAITPNGLSPQDYNWVLPRNPAQASQTSEIPLLGAIGIASNGLPLYGPNEAQMPHPYGDPIFNAITDVNLGHTGGRGDYHYHAILVQTFWPNAVAGDPNVIIGYAFDGFPVYGPYGCLDADCNNVVEFKSGWDAKDYEKVGCTTSADCRTGYRCNVAMVNGVEEKICADETYAWDHNEFNAKSAPEYLDQCNGRVGPDGAYRYHTTSTFPYLLGCYRGTASNQGGGMMMGGGPPQIAIDACTGLSEGDACTVMTPRGNVMGTCTDREGVLFCRPAGGMGGP